MTRDVDQYLSQAQALLPKGLVWDSLKEDDTFNNLLTALMDEFARIDARAEDLINETDPRTAYELLNEWEAFAGLPDTCIQSGQTLGQRRDALLDKLINNYGQSIQFFIDLAAALGYIITITEYQANRHGDVHGQPYGGTDWQFVWQVNSAETTITPNTYGQSVHGERYRTWGNEILECVFNQLVHVHRKIIYSYGG